MQPTRLQFTVFKQIYDLIPPHLVPKLAVASGNTSNANTVTFDNVTITQP